MEGGIVGEGGRRRGIRQDGGGQEEEGEDDGKEGFREVLVHRGLVGWG